MGTDLGGVAEPTQTSGTQRLWSVVIVASAEQRVFLHRGPGLTPFYEISPNMDMGFPDFLGGKKLGV
ncbi:hypothetical protein [Ktedonospora formicarum]|uniref:Uncharacterized protein n=1 Tax=Ktedonospora formicarum TaxID=2778364 RepID=A0A8J3MUY4_9CHLR|nr:hypothetical protein [Ktedonospora formicarum]GHO49842.1 hypothetical protein KSX_80050 [Ktedonospora formicarum]